MNLTPLKKLIDQNGLTKHEKAILDTVRPAILIQLEKAGQGKIGQSRIGGLPDLPASLSWPDNPKYGKHLCFIMQLNVAELPVLTENPLPREGMMYLFLDEGENDAKQLVLYTGNEPLQKASRPDELITDWYDDLSEHTLKFEVFPDVPRWATQDFYDLAQQLGLEGEDEDRLNDVGRSFPEHVGKLFGHAAGIGHDPREDAFVVREVNPEWLYNSNALRNNNVDLSKAKAWQNLLELQSDGDVNLMFGDAGYLQVLIHENDLRQTDFSKVYVNLESS